MLRNSQNKPHSPEPEVSHKRPLARREAREARPLTGEKLSKSIKTKGGVRNEC